MNAHNVFCNLRNALAELYDDETSAKRVVHDACLNSLNISFNSKAINNWHAILLEAIKTNQLEALLNVTLTEYSNNSSLDKAYKDYLKYIDQGSHVDKVKQIAYIISIFDWIQNNKKWVFIIIIIGVLAVLQPLSWNSNIYQNLRAYFFASSTSNIQGCDILGRIPDNVTSFTIGSWEGKTEEEKKWAQRTQDTLYWKFSHIDRLRGFFRQDSSAAIQCKADLGFWIDGEIELADNTILLSANISRGSGEFIQKVQVRMLAHESNSGIESQVLALQEQLAQRILTALEIQVSDEVLKKIHNTPTQNPQALELNNWAVDLIKQWSDDFLASNDLLLVAEEKLRQAIELDPEYADAHHNLGTVLYNQNDFSKAVAEYKLALTWLPHDSEFFYSLGTALESQGNYLAAVEAYNKSLELDFSIENTPVTLNNLGYTYLQMKNYDRAREVLERGLQLTPNAHFLHKNLGRVYFEQGNIKSAIVELQQAITLTQNDNYPEAIYFLTLSQQQLGDSNQACNAVSIFDRIESIAAPEELNTYADRINKLRLELHCKSS